MSERVPPTDAQQQISAYDRQLAEIDKLLGEARNYKAESRWQSSPSPSCSSSLTNDSTSWSSPPLRGGGLFRRALCTIAKETKQ